MSKKNEVPQIVFDFQGAIVRMDNGYIEYLMKHHEDMAELERYNQEECRRETAKNLEYRIMQLEKIVKAQEEDLHEIKRILSDK